MDDIDKEVMDSIYGSRTATATANNWFNLNLTQEKLHEAMNKMTDNFKLANYVGRANGRSFALKVLASPHLTVRTQDRFPRSKKKRIQKKWRNNPKYWSENPNPNCYLTQHGIICHTSIARKINEAIERI